MRAGSGAALLIAAVFLTPAFGCNRSSSEQGASSSMPLATASAPAQASAPAAEGASAEGDLRAGTKPPDFELTGIDGKSVSLAQFHGKVVLLNFWATWCAPCVSEMPSLQRLYQKYHDKGLEIVAVAVDSPDQVKKFVQENGITFPVLLDPEGEIPPKLGISGFPETFFLDKNGNFVAFNDPVTGEKLVRTMSDRPWDSKVFLDAVGAVLNGSSS